MDTKKLLPDDSSLGYARFLSWVSLLLILATSLVLSAVLANYARTTLLTKQKEFAQLLAENLNHQIYRRFTLPTVLAFGRVALRQPAQYERLDQVIQSVIVGLRLEGLRIYDDQLLVTYSNARDELGNARLAPPTIANAFKDGKPVFEILSSIPDWQMPFMLHPKPGTVKLRTIYPLRIESRNEAVMDEPIMGILEITQDITGDYVTVVHFQWLVIGTCLSSSMVLFSLLLMMIRRTERTLAARMAQTRALENELHQHEKLASMGRVVASIAHEIRNPLGIIRSSAELLLRRPNNGDATTKRILEAIFDESCRLSQTVNDFIDYARPRTPRQDIVDLNVVLDQAFAFLESECTRHNVDCVREIADNLRVQGDKDLLYRAVYNVWVNCLQAMPEGGRIKISAHSADEQVCLSFTDSGSGFPPELIDKLLDPFVTTKDNGTGLGLPIVNSIINSHNGTLRLENPEGGGARVYICLPRA